MWFNRPGQKLNNRTQLLYVSAKNICISSCNKKNGSGAVAGKILLVTNACWSFDYWDISRSSNNVCAVNFKFLEPPT